MAASVQQYGAEVLVLLACLMTVVVCVTQTQFNMDDPTHCNNAGFYDVPDDTTLYVNSRSSAAISMMISCELKFRAASDQSSLAITFNSFYINDDQVKLHIVSNDGFSNTYRAGFSKPSSLTLSGRDVSIQLQRTSQSERDYNFQLTIIGRKTKDKNAASASISDSNPMAVGLVVGIVGAILGALIIAAIIGICCYKQIRKKQLRSMSEEDSDSKVRLDERDPSNYSVGCTNSSMSNGRYGVQENNTRGNKRYYPDGTGYKGGRDIMTDGGSSRGDVGYYSDSKKYPSDNDTVDFRPSHGESAATRPQTISNLPSSPKSSSAFHYNSQQEKVEEKITDSHTTPTSPFLAALHANSKFRKSFHSNEADADDRAKRISSSSLQSDASRASVSMSPGGPNSAPVLPSVPIAPLTPTSKRQQHASIRRAARPTSASSEELEAISSGQEGDRNIKLIQYNEPSSPVEIVPIKPRDPYSVKTDNTQHTLKPQRGRNRSPQEKRKKNEKPPQGDKQRKESSQGYVQKEQKDYGGSIGRRGKKSPRLGSNSKGFGHRNKSENDLPSRPGTPTSVYSRDDFESLPPLQRSASRQSLYASRSSLYGRRRRKGSTGSVSSYARDDMEVYRRSRDYDDEEDGYEKPISRKERERMFRSVGDIGKVTKATQTLRETATQTGQEEPYVLQSKIITKKKSKPRSQSVAATQTTKTKPKPASRNAASVSAAVQLDDKSTERKVGKTNDKVDSAKKRDRNTPPITNSTPTVQAAVSDAQPAVKKTGSPINVTSDGQFVVAKNANIITEQMTFTNEQQPAPVTTTQHREQPPAALRQQVPLQYQQGYPPQNMGMQFPQQQPYPVMQPYSQQGGWQNVPQSNPQQFQTGVVGGPGSQMPGIPPQYQWQQQQQAVEPPKPRKSNWDMLCDLTDKDRPKHGSGSEETASMASSVFVSNVPTGMQGMPYGTVGGGQTVPKEAYIASNPPMNYTAYPQPHNTEVQRQSPEGITAESGQTQNSPALPHQSSWDTLKQLTDNQYKLAYGTSESNHTNV